MQELTDFPKLYCPFIRQTFKVNPQDFNQKRAQYKLRAPEVYLVVDRINPGYEWVFDDPDTFAVEKLDGTNIKIKTEAGRLVALQNRKNIIDPLQLIKGQIYILEGVVNSAEKDYILADGEQSGELIGPKLQGNPYKLTHHLWYPFDKTIDSLKYKSFHEHERNFDNWSAWFKDNLFSRFYTKLMSKQGLADKVFAEGVVFYNLKRKAQGQEWRAKLRRDMFIWYYEGLEVYDYNKKGLDRNEDQDKFE